MSGVTAMPLAHNWFAPYLLLLKFANWQPILFLWYLTSLLVALASISLHLRGPTPTAALAWLWDCRNSLATFGSGTGAVVTWVGLWSDAGAAPWVELWHKARNRRGSKEEQAISLARFLQGQVIFSWGSSLFNRFARVVWLCLGGMTRLSFTMPPSLSHS